MQNIDYSTYSFQELLEIENHIDSEANPENDNALKKELESRGAGREEREERVKQQEQAEFSLAEKRVKIIGFFQIAAAIVITYLLVTRSENNAFTFIVGVFLILLNLCAGYTAIKELHRWYWLSIVNQVLQIPSVAVGAVIANYSGLGGAYIEIYWGVEAGFNLSASFSPGFSFLQLTQNIQGGTVSIDFLAVIFVGALLTVKDAKMNAKKVPQEIASD